MNTNDHPNNSVFSETVRGSGVFTIASRIPVEVHETLPPGVYKMVFGEDGSLSLAKKHDKFTVSPFTYDDNAKIVEEVIDLYDARPNSTVAYLRGAKGRGKTTTCCMIANRLIERNIPVFVIDKAVDPFVLQDIAKAVGHCVFMIDEFERKYELLSSDEKVKNDGSNCRDNFLEVFTDKNLKRVLFLLADNNARNDDSGFIHRPDRINYLISFAPYTIKDAFKMLGDKIDTIDPDIILTAKNFLQFSKVGFDAMDLVARTMQEADSAEDFIRKIRYRNACTVLPREICNIKVSEVYDQSEEEETLRYSIPKQELGLEDSLAINFVVYQKKSKNVIREFTDHFSVREIVKKLTDIGDDIRIRGKYCEIYISQLSAIHYDHPGNTSVDPVKLIQFTGASEEKYKAPKESETKEAE